LVALTGQDLGDDAGAWAAWWKANRERARLGLGNAPRRDGYGRFFGIPVPRGRTVFVLDVSGSMRDPVQGGRAAEHIARSPWLAASEIATRLDLARGELAHALEAMPETAEAGVVVYNDEALWITKGIERATEALKARAVKRLGGVAAGDRTNVYAGLAAALHPGQKPSPKDLTEGPDTVFLLSDGNPSTGLIISRPELRDAVLRWNLARDVRIHAVNVGNADASMLRGIAHGTGGTYVDLRSDRESPKEE
jgi:hypothetical protein